MMQITLKRAEPQNIFDPVQRYCKTHHGRAQLDLIRQALQDANNMRQHFSPGEISDASLGVLKKYLFLFHCISVRIPMGQSKGSVNLRFKWTDTLKRPGKFMSESKYASGGALFEKVCVTYNIAAASANLALLNADHRTQESDLQRSITQLRTAAGMFAFIRDNLLSELTGSDQSNDLSPNALEAFISLLLAKAHEILYEKALLGAQSTQLFLSKLANQTSKLYNKARVELLAIDALSNAALVPTLRVYGLAYEAAAYYQKVLSDKIEVDRTTHGFANLIARLRIADSRLKDAERVNPVGRGQELSRGLNLNILKNSITTLLNILENDNYSIYHEPIPGDSTQFYDLESVASVKVIDVTVEDLWEPSKAYIDSFNRLIPSSVQSVINDSMNQAAELENKIEHDFGALQAKLASLQSQTKFDKETLISEAWAHVEEYRKTNKKDFNGVAKISEDIKTLQKYSQECHSMIDAIKEAPKNREEGDGEAKQLEYYETTVLEADNARKKVEESFKSLKHYIKYFTDTKENFVLHISSDYSYFNSVEEVVEGLCKSFNIISESFAEFKSRSDDASFTSQWAQNLTAENDSYSSLAQASKDKVLQLADYDNQLIDLLERAGDAEAYINNTTGENAVEKTPKQALTEVLQGMEELKATQIHIAQGFHFFKKMKELLAFVPQS